MSDARTTTSDVRYELVAEPAHGAPAVSPLRLLRRALRGRYRMAVTLATVLAVLGGVAGYHARPALYESRGLVLIESEVSPILFESRENGVPPMFEAYLTTQVARLQSRQVLDAAVASAALRDAGWPQGRAGVAALQDALTVQRGRREHVLTVSARHREAALARGAVNAVLDAYEGSASAPAGVSISAKERALIERERNLTDLLDDVQDELLLASDHYGYEAISRMHASKVDEIIAVARRLAKVRLDRKRLEQGGALADIADLGALAGEATPSPEETVIAELELLSTRFGPSHFRIQELERRLSAIRARAAGAPASDAPSPLVARAHARLDELATRYETVREEAVAEATRLGRRRIALSSLNDRVVELKDRLAVTRHRLDELRLESRREDASRISIEARGDLPAAPVSDRRAKLAAAGAVLGILAGGGLVFLFGLLDTRIRYADALAELDAAPPVLGVVPALGAETRPDGDVVAGSVHQLRNLLELQRAEPGPSVYAVTSSERGEGRTSLALAIGASFAATGRRTAIVDADVARPDLGRALHPGDGPGVPLATAGTVRPTTRENVWTLTLGCGHGLDPERLSRRALAALLEELREGFDAVVIDTGPLLSSVEACLVAAAADRVVMVVGRHVRLERLRAALARLEQVGGACAGLVFNRAAACDAVAPGAARRPDPREPVPLVPAPGAPRGPFPLVGPGAAGQEDDPGTGRKAA